MPKRVGFLYEKMADRDFIRRCILRAADHKHGRNEVRRVLRDLEGYVDKMYELVVTESFEPSTPKEKEIYDPSSQKWRKIQVVPFFPDGVMHWMLVEAMRPVLMRGMYPWSCASIPGRGGKRVRNYIKRAMENDPKGTKYGEELDVKQYYPSISIRKMMRELKRKIKDMKFLLAIWKILKSCGKDGLAIGFYICQWLANFFLEKLDWLVAKLPGVKHYSRYMDNMTMLGPNKKKLHRARQQIAAFLGGRLGLKLKENWQVYPTAKRAVCAVGYRFNRDHILLRKRNFLRLTRQCRRAQKKLDRGERISFRLAAGIVSRAGQLKHCNSQKVKEKYIYPLGIKKLKEVIQHESARRLSAQRRVYAGAAA